MKPAGSALSSHGRTNLWAATLAGVIATIALLMLIAGYGATWRLWSIPAFDAPFLDMRVVTAASESLALGHDPTVDNIRDPLRREFNYPKTWFPVLRLGLHDNATVPLALLALSLFFAALARLPHEPDTLTVAALAAVTFSPAVMLGYERGNVDLFLFAALGYSILLLEQWPLASWALLTVGAILKIFPLFGVVVFLESRRYLGYVVAFCVFIGIFAALAWSDLARTFAVTPKGADLAYGISVLYRFAATSPGWNPGVVRLATMLAGSTALALAFVGGLKRPVVGNVALRDMRAFRVGAGIYVGTFLLGNNWDYRLMFLIFAVPTLTRWARDGARIPLVTIAALMTSCWYFVLRRPLDRVHPNLGFLVDESANWVLFGGLAFLLSASLPNWFVTLTGLVSARAET